MSLYTRVHAKAEPGLHEITVSRAADCIFNPPLTLRRAASPHSLLHVHHAVAVVVQYVDFSIHRCLSIYIHEFSSHLTHNTDGSDSFARAHTLPDPSCISFTLSLPCLPIFPCAIMHPYNNINIDPKILPVTVKRSFYPLP